MGQVVVRNITPYKVYMSYVQGIDALNPKGITIQRGESVTLPAPITPLQIYYDEKVSSSVNIYDVSIINDRGDRVYGLLSAGNYAIISGAQKVPSLTGNSLFSWLSSEVQKNIVSGISP